MKEILVAVDFSAGSAHALQHALEIAEKFGANLLLLHVVHDPAEAPGFYASKKAGKKVLRNMAQTAEQMMEEFVSTHLKKFKKFKTHIAPGLPPSQIVKLAKKAGVDLIVVGTHGRSGLKRLMLGSVADRVIRSAPCPVLTVHEPKKKKKKQKKGTDADGAKRVETTEKDGDDAEKALESADREVADSTGQAETSTDPSGAVAAAPPETDRDRQRRA